MLVDALGLEDGGRIYYDKKETTAPLRVALNRGLYTHNKAIREDAVEAWFFAHLGKELEKYRLEWEAKVAQCKRTSASIDRAAIRRKLSRLKDLYVNE